jgi:hypothetical protein
VHVIYGAIGTDILILYLSRLHEHLA